MSTALLPEVVPEIDANPVSLYSGGGAGVGWSVQKLKGFQGERGFAHLTP